MSNDVERITAIINRCAKKSPATDIWSPNVLASWSSLDVKLEGWRRNKETNKKDYLGCYWVRRSMQDAYRTPGAVARSMRSEIRSIVHG